MKRPLVGTAAAAFAAAVACAGLAASPAAAADGIQNSPAHTASPRAAAQGSAQPAPAAKPGFAGTVALDNCSGSLVKMPESKPDDPALVLSNGHCREDGMPEPGQVVTDEPSQRSFGLLKDDGSEAGKVNAEKLSYATMTDTDVSLYQVGSTYQQIEDKYQVKPLEVQAEPPKKGTDITVVSGYWKETYSCGLDGVVPQLKEGGWTQKNSLRYTKECETKGGTSGSPVIDDASGKVVGVNNTRNEDGGKCTMNNPCEVDKQGKVTVRKGIAYGQQTALLTQCVGAGNKLDLDRQGCELPKPKS